MINGCVDKLPVFPVQTEDSDWAPTISLSQNGYQRFDMNLTRPPRKELLRNLLYHEVQLSSGGSPNFVTIDTINATDIDPSYIYWTVYPLEEHPFSFYSGPILDYGHNYTVRIRTVYSTGSTKLSNELSFITPTQVGRVTQRLPVPKRVDYETSDPYIPIAFHKGDFIVRRSEQIFRVDTATGDATLITKDFWPPSSVESWEAYEPIMTVGDTLLTYCRIPSSSSEFLLMTLDLNSLQVDRSRTLSVPGQFQGCTIGPGSLLYVLCTGEDGERFMVFDWRDGQLLETSPTLPATLVLSRETGDALSFDENGFWYSRVQYFDNRLWRLDSTTFAVLEEHRNPVFSPAGLAWDGANFWVIDQETRTIAKLQLEGM
jgi:hypothetical protein